MQNAKKLRVYHAAEELAVLVYRVVRQLPPDERFCLGQQLRRAAVSVGSNIAEGSARGGNAELTRFLHFALGSATEIEFQLRLAVRLELLASSLTEPPLASCVAVQRMLTRLIVRLRPITGMVHGRPQTEAPKHRGTRSNPDMTPTPAPGSHVATATAPSP
jgi:four helix bundle protein